MTGTGQDVPRRSLIHEIRACIRNSDRDIYHGYLVSQILLACMCELLLDAPEHSDEHPQRFPEMFIEIALPGAIHSAQTIRSQYKQPNGLPPGWRVIK